MLYQIFFKQSKEIMLIIRYDDYYIVEANDSAIEAYGYSREELLKMRIDELYDSEAWQASMFQIDRSAGCLVAFETVHRRKDGSKFFVEVNLHCGSFQGVNYLQIIIRDIGEGRQHIAQEVKQQEDVVHKPDLSDKRNVTFEALNEFKKTDRNQLITDKGRKADIGILIVDDDRLITDYISMGLIYEGYQVYTAYYGKDALELVKKVRIDAVILDWMLPDIQGLDLCRRLRELINPVIIMVTGKDEFIDRVNGLRAGADDYMVKPFNFAELLARLEAQLRRQTSSPEKEVLTYADITIWPTRREARRGQLLLLLTPTEFDLLLLFMRHPRQVLPKEIILQQIWGHNFTGDLNIVEVYIGYLRRKLQKPSLIHTVRGVGYLFEQQN
ncbi:two component transcriptional regulator, winged helix family [Desulfofarcimen acetoxidans DSM 771]|uniref:Stage 0 sporulation protein A homolog n=1 Tax=Desulfofarcimen acetoxidans (strain ATCC 49208 / DSM 771 / KCTC 5769 / VKM B-1644 / 5575) TaxID=485916 RepID=C8W041_DESAS|nr:response regulator [Desulfofarcimen acetoxidans]ACV65009.1 two component transcriptional regulator, winged helix family [Desulfofarcimen acetoxidans DSM 771]